MNKFSDMKYVVVDTETTGLDPKVNAMHELAAIRWMNKACRELPDFATPHNQHILPPDWAQVELKALEACGLTRYAVTEKAQVDYYGAHQNFKRYLSEFIHPMDKLDKAYLVGYNIKFDEGFLRALWDDNRDKYFGSYFYYPCIDVAALVAICAGPLRYKYANMKLATACRIMEVPFDESQAHGALYDCTKTLELFQACCAKLNI